MSASQHASQPFFVLNDAAYDRIYQKLSNGSRFEWTYPGTCPHPRGQCVCPKFMNVLKDGKIIRIVNGMQKPVYKASEIQEMHPDGNAQINLFIDRFKTNPIYVESLKEVSDSIQFPATVTIYMDSCVTTPPIFTLTCPSKEDFCTLVDGLKVETHPYLESEFVPIAFSNDLLALEVVKDMKELVNEGRLTSWELGRKGTHISSRFCTDSGKEDTLTSPNAADEDFESLCKAHIQRAVMLLTG